MVSATSNSPINKMSAQLIFLLLLILSKMVLKSVFWGECIKVVHNFSSCIENTIIIIHILLKWSIKYYRNYIAIMATFDPIYTFHARVLIQGAVQYYPLIYDCHRVSLSISYSHRHRDSKHSRSTISSVAARLSRLSLSI